MSITGSVLSRFTVTVVVAVFPALSTAVPVISWPAASAETTIGDGQTAIPDSVSLHAKLMVTSALFQPAALGSGVMVAMMVGAVLSIFKAAATVAVLPARSSTVRLMV